MTKPLPLTQMVHHPENDESADENQIKTRIIQLDTSNWVQWSCQMKNYLKGCGYQELLHPPSDTAKITSKYEHKNSAALAMLWTLVCNDLQGVLLKHEYLFFNAWEALGDACGRNSIIPTCEALFRLYGAYKSITYNTDFKMDLPPSMAAAFFLCSFSKDKELTGLIQTLYDSKPFDIITVKKQVSLEHTRRQNDSEEVLFNKPSTSKEDDKKGPKAHDNQSRGKRRNEKKKADSKPGYRYILALLDDFSRFNRIVFLKTKDQAGREIISFINKIRNKLNKITCLLNQSNIPVSYWDQATAHASLLLNNNPHWFLNIITPAKCLENHNSPIEPHLNISQLISFGAKVSIKNESPDSKITGGSSPLHAFTFEQYSDSMKFLKIDNGRVKISPDYVPSVSDKPVQKRKPTQSLPSETVQITLPKPTSSSTTLPMDQIEVSTSTSNNAPHPEVNEVQPKGPGPKKTWEYVLYYKKDSKDVSISISTDNVIEGSRRKKNNGTFLMDVVPYSAAINHPLEQQEWFNVMQKEFDSLMQHNTSELVPYPKN
ncbi:hypothetical protein O181_021362 [Austropuccinia psidii MF-1]|uniref:Integrase catalytic domain-containing protein n=1 Tax=Austropuccinia psidii MF-1 TaxID=1389203 RepID=A0A9Q3GW71_9BASI|nr:hypothetical protein [Austropuccinia psidii MF-1]